jgi:Flp pilus assembly protein TadD
LRELRRNIARSARSAAREQELRGAFEEDPAQPKVGAALARLLARQGQTFAAYVVVFRAMQQRPDDTRLAKLRDKIGRAIPPDERADLEAEA